MRILQTAITACFLLVLVAGTVHAEEARKKIIAAVPADFPPTFFQDPSGKPAGFSVDVMNELARRSGLTVEYVYGEAWDEIQEMVLSGDADLIPGLTIDSQRKELFAFTDSIEYLPANLMVGSENHTVKGIAPGLSIGVMKASAAEHFLENNKTIELKTYTSLQKLLFELLSGNVDGIVTTTPNLMKLAIEAGIDNKIKVVGAPIIELKRGIALRKGDSALVARLNKAIGEFVGTAEYKNIYVKWYGKPKPYWTVGRIAAVSGISLFIIVCGMAFWRYRSLLLLNTSLKQSIEERTKVEEELQRTRFTIDHAADAVFWIQPDASIVDANEAACRSLGYTREELLALKVEDVDVFYSAEEWPAHWSELVANKSIVFESKQRKKNGLEFPVEISANHLLFGEREFNCAFVRDITERKRAEEEHRNMEQQLLHAQKLESLGVLAGGIAHDFNNILTSIIGNADLALMRINKESPAVDNLHRIEQAALRAADLAKQMLAYSGKGKFVVENMDLNCILEEMLYMLEVSISKKAVLRFNQHQQLPLVEADATQLRQIIMNLVINASEAIGDRSGVIAITTGCMECDRSYLKNVWLDENLTDGLYVYLEIADTGCGMDKETMAKLFDPFFTTKFTGRGLGMAAVMGIVRGHKGAIKVYSEVGKGTTFKILFPASGRPAENYKGESLKDDWRGSGTVLLVDDEDTIRGVGTEMLKELGFSTITADDGREAVEVFKQNPDISLVILDLTMPHMDGEQCFRELRRLDPDVKVIISSGYNEQEVAQKFLGKGLAGFIQKPYKLSVLKEAIRGLEIR
jgi:PAS domain S-box-containing protein